MQAIHGVLPATRQVAESVRDAPGDRFHHRDTPRQGQRDGAGPMVGWPRRAPLDARNEPAAPRSRRRSVPRPLLGEWRGRRPEDPVAERPDEPRRDPSDPVDYAALN